MDEEAKLREEIEESTGVSSRGFLIPKREIREKVQGMLSSGNQREILAEQDDVKATPAQARPRTAFEVCVLCLVGVTSWIVVPSVPYVLMCETRSSAEFRNVEGTHPAASDFHSIGSSYHRNTAVLG